MKIGVIGAGMIGGTLGKLWAEQGHEVMVSSRHPEELEEVLEEIGHGARAGLPEEAAAFGEVLLLAVPFKATVALAEQIAAHVEGKVVLDANNPIARRDGEVAERILEGGEGSGTYTASLFGGARVVKAFNTVYFKRMLEPREGDAVGVPLAADDPEAMEVAAGLVRDAGMEPVEVGPLRDSARFETGTSVWNSGATAAELREALEL